MAAPFAVLVVYRVKKARHGQVKQRVMTPLECLGRLAAMVPPPRYPLLRLHGVLGPRHRWRARVVPRPLNRMQDARSRRARRRRRAGWTRLVVTRRLSPSNECRAVTFCRRQRRRGQARPRSCRAPRSRPPRRCSRRARRRRSRRTLSPSRNGSRILGGERYAPLSRVEWATLLRRTFDVDVTSCVACGGRMTVRAVVTDPASIAKLLRALQRPRAPPASA